MITLCSGPIDFIGFDSPSVPHTRTQRLAGGVCARALHTHSVARCVHTHIIVNPLPLLLCLPCVCVICAHARVWQAGPGVLPCAVWRAFLDVEPQPPRLYVCNRPPSEVDPQKLSANPLRGSFNFGKRHRTDIQPELCVCDLSASFISIFRPSPFLSLFL